MMPEPTRKSPPEQEGNGTLELPAPVLNGLIACANYPLIYFNIPKSACTTIKNLLYFLDHGDYPEEPLEIHKSVSSGQVLIGRHQPEAFASAWRRRRLCFTFVRHPLKRAYSCFNEKFFYQDKYSFGPLRKQVLEPEYGAQFPEPSEAYSLEQHADNFARFLRMVADSQDSSSSVSSNPHWAPQSRALFFARQSAEIDFVGRIEHYAEDMRYVLECVRAPDVTDLLAARFNEGLPAPYPYREVLTDEILALGREIYRDDLIRFGYGLEAQ